MARAAPGSTVACIEESGRITGEAGGAAELIGKAHAAHPTRLHLTTLGTAARILTGHHTAGRPQPHGSRHQAVQPSFAIAPGPPFTVRGRSTVTART